MKVTAQDVREAASARGGYSKAQVAYAQAKFPGQWKRQLIGADVTDEWWQGFYSKKKGKKKKKVKQAPKVINTVSVKKDDWSWKPDDKDIPPIKILNKGKGNKNSGRKKEKLARVSRLDNDDFYKSREWRELRVRVLEKYECKCMMCGRSPKDHGIVIHVDHIKPRSKYPELSLRINNLQILCADCNVGKSNKYQTDWRPDTVDDITKELDMSAIINSPL